MSFIITQTFKTYKPLYYMACTPPEIVSWTCDSSRAAEYHTMAEAVKRMELIKRDDPQFIYAVEPRGKKKTQVD